MRIVLCLMCLALACSDDAAPVDGGADVRDDAAIDARTIDASGLDAPGVDAGSDAGTDAGFDPTMIGLGDEAIHPVPATGDYAYATFRPDMAGFLAAGESYVDPTFGTRITRVSDLYPAEDLGNVPYARNGFANANGARVFSPVGVLGIDGLVVDAAAPGAAGFQQSFDPVDPDVYYYHSGSSLMRYDLSTSESSLVRDFGEPLGSLGGSVDWIDRTGRYMAVNIGGVARVYDSVDDELFVGELSSSTVGAGWLGISPDARWLVVAGDSHRAFAVDPGAKTLDSTGHVFWTLCGDHGDLMSTSDGKTYMLTQECYDFPHVYSVDVSITQTGDDAAGRQKQRDDNRFLFAIEWDDGTHFSGASTGGMEDWGFISTERMDAMGNDPAGTWAPYMNEIIMVNVMTGVVRRLAHHRSDITGYCTQPRVQVSWDGSGVFYASNYGADQGSCGYSDLYHIQLR